MPQGREDASCVEVALAWRKSTYSNFEDASCVEVAACPTAVHVRDSKLTDSPELALPAAAWEAFLAYGAGQC
ncbi:DUF397 domain-containing protein [Streptomyces camponoticapitis]|uniref:DUF397 domain-containing protein n=1 Tax=Streptomyces camponoticapitis TaxID=1616125 RepID=UPI0016670FB6|nr:DUF397 domain-containing protein [Streptomyces camponoticapitis]